jgi:hypothetical protein
MLQLLLGGGAHADHGDVERERHAGERMVPVERDDVAFDRHDA